MLKRAYTKTLGIARKELHLLYREREALDRKIARLRQTVYALTALEHQSKDFDGDVSVMPSTLTEAVALELQTSRKPLDVPDIRDRLEALGYRFKSSNPLASVHSVVRRMMEQGLVRAVWEKPESGDVRLHTRALWWGETLPHGWITLTEEQLAAALRRADDRVNTGESTRSKAKPRRPPSAPARRSRKGSGD